MQRTAFAERTTAETDIRVEVNLDGAGDVEVSTGIGFFDHMLSLLGAHGFLDLKVTATGDLEVDYHHTVEDVGIVLGDALGQALGDRKGIRRYGHAVTPMDESLAEVSMDLSNRPFLVYGIPSFVVPGTGFDAHLGKEFFRALATRAGMTLHIQLRYGENEHHILEAVFKAFGRSLQQAVSVDERIVGVRSTKGSL